MKLQVFLLSVGDQGYGKTISMVNYAKQLAKYYPKLVIVSNVVINDLPDSTRIIYFKSIDELFRLFDEVKNGYAGVLYL